MDEVQQINAKVQITGTLVFHDAQGNEVGTIELCGAEVPLKDAHEGQPTESGAASGNR